MNFFGSRGVKYSREFDRISKIPRRVWSDQETERVTSQLTKLLKTPEGTMSLRPVQAQALFEIAKYGGLLGPIGVGNGKTIISLLAPVVLGSKRALLLMPAALISKTENERRKLSKHWQVCRYTQLYSYDMLSRVNSKEFLHKNKPDLIIMDEAHRVKNKKAGVTKRIIRYLDEFPQTKVVCLSGTMMRGSLEDFAHIAKWCLRERCPLPTTYHELQEWIAGMDDSEIFFKTDPGVLTSFATEEELDQLHPKKAARLGFQRRLKETPGVVVSENKDKFDGSLYIVGEKYKTNSTTEEYFIKLRDAWERPDGWAFSQAMDIWRCSQELALGMFYSWDPAPPQEWLNARRDWSKFVREILADSKHLDTEKQVAMACEDGELSDEYYKLWKALEPTFKIIPKVTWHDFTALEICEKWAKDNRGIIWCKHTFFAEELAKRTGLKYYGEKGFDKDGNFIETADPKLSVIASVAANKEGRNLQEKWNKNLITCPSSHSGTWEQLLGRTHRHGQVEDFVQADVLIGCAENFYAIPKALKDAEKVQDMTGMEQKVLCCDLVWPTEAEIKALGTSRWVSKSLDKK